MDAEISRMKEKGKKEDDIKEWKQLATEVTQAINSKQLEPTMRTQYMRTAFQIPFDATVRVSLDTNLCMINERTEDSMAGKRWFRDPDAPVPGEEITRFPHAVLEVKLQLEGEGMTPPWVTELINSGMLMQVHKFSKFIHGCATLMPEEVVAVPYWIDDVTLADSIAGTEGAKLLIGNQSKGDFEHLIPHDKAGKIKAPDVKKRVPPPHPATAAYQATHGGQTPITTNASIMHDFCEGCLECEANCFCSAWGGRADIGTMNTQKIEPKLYFANERTFIKWLEMAVILASIAVGVLAFSKGGEDGGRAELFALMLLPISLIFIAYATVTYLWRSAKIRAREAERWDDPYGPVLITLMLIFALVAQFTIKVLDITHKAEASATV
jgi:uncharacterized membrane protein YidH (DUF202 family)